MRGLQPNAGGPACRRGVRSLDHPLAGESCEKIPLRPLCVIGSRWRTRRHRDTENSLKFSVSLCLCVSVSLCLRGRVTPAGLRFNHGSGGSAYELVPPIRTPAAWGETAGGHTEQRRERRNSGVPLLSLSLPGPLGLGEAGE